MMTVLSLWPVDASALTNKTLRVEHGRPLVIVSDKAVLWLEFLKESVGEALVPHREADIRHCRAQYRYQLYDGITGFEKAVTDRGGGGMRKAVAMNRRMYLFGGGCTVEQSAL